MKFLRHFLLFLLLFVVSCSTAYNPPSFEKASKATAKDLNAYWGGNEEFNKKLVLSVGRIKIPPYRLMPGDAVKVSVFGVEELEDLTGKIDAAGKVSFPLVGSVKIGGLTLAEARKVVKKALETYVMNPKVNLEVTEYKGFRVSVLGEVNKPDVYSLTGTRTVLDVLAMAGGLTDKASKTVILTHIGPEKNTVLYLNLDKLVDNMKFFDELMLKPGDILYIPKAENIYVDGFVRRPGSFSLTQPTSVTAAITEAGGMKIDADPTQVAIYRTLKTGEKKMIKVNIDNIRNGEEKNIMLQPNDVVIVPSNGLKVFVYHFFGFGWGPSGPTARAGR
ncbi:MAG: hypothetical protein DSY91_07080 [Deltaproteobacteria bacterium]|nr:MAG: hypothetical protein DSY91_07080 [Deltaproteobacteria bacterium]